MMGKVLGIGAMGLTQMVVWGAMILGGTAAAGSVAALFVDPSMLDLPEGASQAAVREAVGTQIPSVDPGLVAWFILFFLGGYLLYASLYAAVGSAVEQMQDAQNLLLPLTLPLLIPLMFIFFIIESPNATLSVVLSMVPFFAPILMITRLAITDVALWQPVVAYLLLAGTFVGAIWASARIYRVGILMYGKTPSLRELARWITYS
jgi:ABC-2 type transport system permease protein